MDIGTERKKITVEPIENPVPDRGLPDPAAPDRAPEPEPEPVEPERVPA
jgi:hypothetical protein